MPQSTNVLVNGTKRFVAPAVLSAAVALGTVAAVNHNNVHAAAVTASPLDDHSVAALTSLDQAMETLAARVTPAVVNIAVTSTPSGDEEEGGTSAPQQQLPPEFQQFFGPNGPLGGMGGGQMRPQQPQLQHGIGSGVIISPDGYIVTNNHVVDGAKDIKVTLHDRRILNGKVIGVDKLTDLAVVKVNAHDLPFISWGDSSKLEPGQTVLAFGSPFGYLQFSVTRGIVSAVNRPDPFAKDAHRPGGFIQTDAAINPGNSGGPLVDAHGEVVGINNMIYTNTGSFEGAGFAIPSQIARSVTEQLIAHGEVKHGYVGIAMNDVTPDNAHFFGLHDAEGAIVAQVSPDSPAAQAGLKQGDVITTFNGQKVSNSSSLQVDVSQVGPGAKVSFGVLRNGQPTTVNVTVGTYNPNGTQVAANDGNGGANNGKLGLAVGDLTQEERAQLQLPASVHGAVVQQVRPASPAEDAGLQPGDVILEVNRKPTDSASQFVSQVHAGGQGDVLLLVWSNGNASYRTVHPSDGQNG
ncbi:MAG TPA: Do family serine endopeptidase [Acidobacteriaceae bacterium]|nr:Do family serine endopeptidase [Acidobacteriaceae bacterium]